MIKTKGTKRALTMSMLSLFLCFAMLLGTTFAWFTDSAISANNIIQSGNLDIVLEYYNGTEWKEVAGSDELLDGDALWEPGHAEVVYLRMRNAGSLALKYQFGINIVSEQPGVNKAGEPFKLSDYIYFDVADGVNGQTNAYATREDAMRIATETTKISAGYNTADVMEGNSEFEYFAVVVYMPTSVTNVANHNGIDVPHINLGVNILATQATVESDSFGNTYDADARYLVAAASVEEIVSAIENGNDISLETPIVIDDAFMAAYNARMRARTIVIENNAVIDGNGITIYRTEETKDQPLISVAEGYTLTLSNIVIDGGANWTGEINPYLLRGTENSGMTTTGALITTEKNAHVVLGEGAVLQNNDGANAVFLNTRVGCTLTLNGGEILNNHSAAGAIWGGGAITINDGKVNGNHGGIGGAIRIVTNIGTVLTMNGGEMNHNVSDGVGGAIWAGSSRSNNVYVLNGGEMAYNYSPSGGGAIYAGYYETVKIGGTFKMHHNEAPLAGAIRFHDHASFVMTGGEIYDNGDNSLFLYNNSTSITGGKISDTFTYYGGLGLTLGEAEITSVIAYDLATTHNTAYLAAEFGTFRFTVNEASANFANFNFKPNANYVYTAGDEAKLICMNEGYTTYWDAATSTFRLQATN